MLRIVDLLEKGRDGKGEGRWSSLFGIEWSGEEVRHLRMRLAMRCEAEGPECVGGGSESLLPIMAQCVNINSRVPIFLSREGGISN